MIVLIYFIIDRQGKETVDPALLLHFDCEKERQLDERMRSINYRLHEPELIAFETGTFLCFFLNFETS